MLLSCRPTLVRMSFFIIDLLVSRKARYESCIGLVSSHQHNSFNYCQCMVNKRCLHGGTLRSESAREFVACNLHSLRVKITVECDNLSAVSAMIIYQSKLLYRQPLHCWPTFLHFEHLPAACGLENSAAQSHRQQFADTLFLSKTRSLFI
jgi:hypothetical protein